MVDRVRLDTNGKFYDAVGTMLEPGVLPVAKRCDVMDEVGEPAFWIREAAFEAAAFLREVGQSVYCQGALWFLMLVLAMQKIGRAHV